MDPLELLLDTLDSLDSAFHPLYTEQDGKFVLTGVKGMKTQADIDRMQTGLQKERDAHKETREKLTTFSGFALTPDEMHEKLDRFDELEAAAGGKIDDTKLNEMVEARIKSKMAPLERLLETAQQEGLEKDGIITGYTTMERTRTISDHVRKATTEAKIIGTAVDDVLILAERMFDVNETGEVVTKDNVGVTPGVTAAVWLTDMQKTRPHWWPESQGGGARGSGGGTGFGGANPFSAEGWNMTEQGKLLKTDRTRAEQMAQAAGTTIGGGKPAAKK